MTTNNPSLAKDLIRIHKVITRGLEVGLRKGEEYLSTGFSIPEELAGYSSYIHCFEAVLGSHHTGEDLIAFPAFRKVLPLAPYSQLSVDHHGVELLLALLAPAIADLSGGKHEEGLRVIVDTLSKISEVWYPHIQLEEENFAQEKLNAVLTFEEQKNIADASSKHSQEHSEPPYWVVPFVLFNLEQEERANMAAFFPPVIMNELIPIVWKDQWAPMKPFLLD
jgi:hypothetical protein